MSPTHANCGFIAGTLVHTDQGPLPIGQLKVGDLVLSAPESGEGQAAYKPVVKTLISSKQPIIRMTYNSPEVNEPDKVYALTTAINHPFWIEGMGWTAAIARWKSELEEGRLRLMSRSTVLVFGQGRVFKTDQPGIGWIGSRSRLGAGALWDYSNGKLAANGVYYNWQQWNDGDMYGQNEHPNLYMTTTVHNIKVAGFHTYFVGKHGVWVHDSNPIA